jgi:hypothetical protein
MGNYIESTSCSPDPLQLRKRSITPCLPKGLLADSCDVVAQAGYQSARWWKCKWIELVWAKYIGENEGMSKGGVTSSSLEILWVQIQVLNSFIATSNTRGVTNLVTPDDKVSWNMIRLWTRLQQAFDTSWRLSRATDHETRIDKRACPSAFIIMFISTLDTSCNSWVDLVKLFKLTNLTGGDRYKDEVKNDTLGNGRLPTQKTKWP